MVGLRKIRAPLARLARIENGAGGSRLADGSYSVPPASVVFQTRVSAEVGNGSAVSVHNGARHWADVDIASGAMKHCCRHASWKQGPSRSTTVRDFRCHCEASGRWGCASTV